MRRWIRSIASSRRSSLSTSSQRPAPSAAIRPRNPALTARSMPTACTRVVPISGVISARIWSSLPTWPSVTSTRTRSRPVEPASRVSPSRSGVSSSVPPRASARDRCSTARKRWRSLASDRPPPRSAGRSTTLSKVSTAKRSPAVSVSTTRAAARRAATIFQPPMLPERSSSSTTSRSRTVPPSSSGGRSTSWKVPSGSSGSSGTHIEPEPSPAYGRRRMKSRSARSPGAISIRVPSRVTVCRLERISPSPSPAGSMSTPTVSRRGLGKPGSSTGE